MPPVHRRLAQTLIAALCVAGLAGCGVNVTNGTPYWLPRANNHNYTLTLMVQPSSGVQVDGVWVIVNGGGEQGMLQDPTTRTKWTFSYNQTTDTALKVKYRVAYTVGSPFAIVAPGQHTVTLPKAGEWVVPILGSRAADSDADTVADSADNCVYQSNTNQAPDNPTGDRAFGVPCSTFGTQPGGPTGSIEFYQNGATEGVTVMQNNTGHRMLTAGGKRYYAFLMLASATGSVSAIRGDSGVSQAMLDRINIEHRNPWRAEISDCKLAYQDVADGELTDLPQGGLAKRFIETYAGDGAHSCALKITEGEQTLLTGKDALITVRTNVDDAAGPSVPDFGKAIMFGRVTLNPPPSGGSADGLALYNALTRGSPVHYAYFFAKNFEAKVDTSARDYCEQNSPEQASCVIGKFVATTEFVFPRP